MPEVGQRIAKEMNEVDCMAHANHCQDGKWTGVAHYFRESVSRSLSAKSHETIPIGLSLHVRAIFKYN